MNKRKVTKVFNKAELEKFTLLPIVRMDLLSESIGDSTKDNVKLAEAVDNCLSMMLSKPALKKVTSRKMYVHWSGCEKLYPILDRVEVFRYGKRKYLMVAYVIDEAPE